MKSKKPTPVSVAVPLSRMNGWTSPGSEAGSPQARRSSSRAWLISVRFDVAAPCVQPSGRKLDDHRFAARRIGHDEMNVRVVLKLVFDESSDKPVSGCFDRRYAFWPEGAWGAQLGKLSDARESGTRIDVAGGRIGQGLDRPAFKAGVVTAGSHQWPLDIGERWL